MYKQTINYTDYNGVARSEDFYFHLTEAEMTELEVSKDGGLAASCEAMAKKEDGKNIAEVIKEFILKSYGEKSVDGKRFIKVRDGHKLAEDFEQSPAYSELFMSLLRDANAASDFINGVVPAAIADKMAEIENQHGSEPKLSIVENN